MTDEKKVNTEKKDIFDKLMSLPVLNIFEPFYKKNKEPLMYLFFGVLTTVVSFITAGIGKAALESLGASKGAVSLVSSVFSWICAVTFAYVTNRIWVFSSSAKGRQILSEAASFYGGRVFTLIVEAVMMTVGYSLLGFNYWVVKIVANVVVLILNYVISKLLVFRNKK